MQADPVTLFVYDLLLAGEREHELLNGAAFLGVARTRAECTLVDLGFFPALLLGGDVSVVGELYRIDKKTRFELDVKRQCPVLFQRVNVTLEDGSVAETYVMREEQVRGKRRLKQGSWRDRFLPRPRTMPTSPLIEALKKR